MKTRIILGNGEICMTAGSFHDADNVDNVYVGLKMSPLKKVFEVGQDITNAEDIDDSVSTFIKIENEKGLQALERAVKRMRQEWELLNERRSYKDQADGRSSNS